MFIVVCNLLIFFKIYVCVSVCMGGGGGEWRSILAKTNKQGKYNKTKPLLHEDVLFCLSGCPHASRSITTACVCVLSSDTTMTYCRVFLELTGKTELMAQMVCQALQAPKVPQ